MEWYFYDIRSLQVLPSITNEVLKQVVAEFDAGELITMREQVLYKLFMRHQRPFQTYNEEPWSFQIS